MLLVFLGRAWQYWFYDAPYRELLWDQERMEPLLGNIFGINWSQWVTNPRYDVAIAHFIDGVGIFYLVCCLAVLLLNKFPKLATFLLWTGALSLFLLAGLYFKAKLYNFGEFMEYALQFSSPVILVFLFREKKINPRLTLAIKMAIALTFVGHGLYAVNFHPRPANFLVMCINILELTESQAVIFLNLAGTLDFVIAIAIFLPFRKVNLIALAYAASWGFATAMARPWAYFYVDFWQDSLHRWWFEAAFRMIHSIGPLVLFLYYRRIMINEKEGLAPMRSEQDQILT